MQTICPHCQTELNAGNQLAGQKTPCTACDRFYVVPTPPNGAFSATPLKSSESAFSAEPLASADDAPQDYSPPDLRALKMFRAGRKDHEIVAMLLSQGFDLEQAMEALNQGRSMYCAEFMSRRGGASGVGSPSSSTAILLCILGGLMVLIGIFASFVSYSVAIDDAKVGGSGKYTIWGGLIAAGVLLFFRGISTVRQ